MDSKGDEEGGVGLSRASTWTPNSGSSIQREVWVTKFPMGFVLPISLSESEAEAVGPAKPHEEEEEDDRPECTMVGTTGSKDAVLFTTGACTDRS